MTPGPDAAENAARLSADPASAGAAWAGVVSAVVVLGKAMIDHLAKRKLSAERRVHEDRREDRRRKVASLDAALSRCAELQDALDEEQRRRYEETRRADMAEMRLEFVRDRYQLPAQAGRSGEFPPYSPEPRPDDPTR